MNVHDKTARESFRGILNEISDTLEGGEIIEHFEDYPVYSTVLSCINTIVSGRLKDMRTMDEIIEKLEKVKNDEVLEV